METQLPHIVHIILLLLCASLSLLKEITHLHWMCSVFHSILVHCLLVVLSPSSFLSLLLPCCYATYVYYYIFIFCSVSVMLMPISGMSWPYSTLYALHAQPMCIDIALKSCHTFLISTSSFREGANSSWRRHWKHKVDEQSIFTQTETESEKGTANIW